MPRIPKFLDLKPFIEGASYYAGYGSTEPATKGFAHLLPANRTALRKFNKTINGQKRRQQLPPPGPLRIPAPQDRIKQWNIVPGDRVGLANEPGNDRIYDVVAIDRILNKVLLKDTSSTAKNLLHNSRNQSEDEANAVGHKAVDYWNCKLYLGEGELPPDGTTFSARSVPFFAKRMKKSAPKFDAYRREWVWKRYAIAITPRIPDYRLQTTIPWPKRTQKQTLPATYLDTPADVVKRVTYKPPMFSLKLSSPIPRAPSKEDFLFSIMNTHLPRSFHASQPIEVHLVDELSNPHARAKKIQRWQQTLENRKALLRQLITEQQRLYNLPAKEARAQAIVIWKDKIDAQQKSKKKMFASQRAVVDNLAKKNRKKKTKTEKIERKLREMSLAAAPNQYLPPAMVQ